MTLDTVRVKDGFDDWWDLTIPPGEGDPDAGPDEAPGPWSLFRTRGLDRSSLVVWPTASTPLSGPALDDVILGVDEDANVMWAVELRADGSGSRAVGGCRRRSAGNPAHEDAAVHLRAVDNPARALAPVPHRDPPRPRPAGIRPGARRRSQPGPTRPRDGPQSELIGAGAGHELAASAVPNQGMRLERRYTLARGTDGRPVLWRQRRRLPVLGGPVSHLRFDLLKEEPAP